MLALIHVTKGETHIFQPGNKSLFRRYDCLRNTMQSILIVYPISPTLLFTGSITIPEEVYAFKQD